MVRQDFTLDQQVSDRVYPQHSANTGHFNLSNAVSMLDKRRGRQASIETALA